MQRPVILLLNRVPALSLTVLFHVALIILLLNAIPKQAAPFPIEPETEFVLVPLMEPTPVPKRRRNASGGGSNAITTHFNPYTFNPQSLQAPRGLTLALASCAPENYDRQSEEVRAACSRIQTVLASNYDRFGVKIDFMQGKRWERELLIKQTPLLAPCMSPEANVLYTLFCIYDVVMHGYDPDKMQHYSK